MAKNLSDLVRGWLAKGDSDVTAAASVASSSGPYDTGCFHCQQAVEKYLKAILVLHGRVPPKTHNIRQLILAVEKVEPAVHLSRPEVLALTRYAVKLRYDADFWPTLSELSNAMAVARQVRLEVLVVIPANMHPTSGPP
jgi:HEPN domain-containing protein